MFEVIDQSETNVTLRRIFFQIVTGSNGITPVTGMTGSVFLSKNGAAFAASSGNIVELSSTNAPGRYYIELASTEINTPGQLLVRYKNTTTAEVIAQASIVNYNPLISGSTLAEISGAIWNALQANHTGSGTFGANLNIPITSVSSSVWGAVQSGYTTAGTFGAILNNPITSVSSSVWGATQSGFTVAGTFGAILNSPITSVSASVWNALRGTFGTAGTFGEGITSVRGNVHGNVTGSVTTASLVTGIGTGGITSSSFAATAINSSVIAIATLTSQSFATGSLTAAGLASDAANEIADAYLDRTDAVETGLTPRQTLRLVAASVGGKLSGAGTSTITIRNAVADTVNRIVATVDASGSRTAITYSL